MKMELKGLLEVSRIKAGLESKGFYLAKDCVEEYFCDALRIQVLKAVEQEAKEYPNEEMFGRILFAPVYGGAFLEVLEAELIFEIADHLLGWESILYTMTSSCLPPNGKNHTSRIHRDTHLDLGGLIPSIGVQIMLDDFTSSNGATQFLHLESSASTPTDLDFDHAEQILAPKGSILFFDTRCWHRSTTNESDDWRCCLLMACTRNWMKQRFDVVEMMKDVELSDCSEKALKRLGIPSHPPRSYDEFFKGKQRF
ncbi:MAG: hypothetical protein ACJAYA_000232 [Bacteroidia bacterium]|jgi:hypothetical protein